LIVDVEGKRLVNSNPDLSLLPASNMKIVVAAVALDVLGEDFQYVTQLVGRVNGDAVEGVLEDLLLQLGRLELVVKERQVSLEALATAVQGVVHLLALGGYALPLASCARTSAALEPPLGNWEWRCSLLPGEGFVIGAIAGAQLVLNASELALLQRLLRPALPRRRDGELMGPVPVWLRLLQLVELWSREHLGRAPRSWRLLRSCFADGASS